MLYIYSWILISVFMFYSVVGGTRIVAMPVSYDNEKIDDREMNKRHLNESSTTTLLRSVGPVVPEQTEGVNVTTFSIVICVIALLILAIFIIGVVIIYRYNKITQQLEVEGIYQDEDFIGSPSDKEEMKNEPKTPSSRLEPDDEPTKSTKTKSVVPKSSEKVGKSNGIKRPSGRKRSRGKG